MNHFPKPDETNDYLAQYLDLLIGSLRKLKGVCLTDSSLSLKEQAKQVFEAPYVLLAHNATADPVFQYANKMGLALFEMSWEEFIVLPSRYSAEPQNRDERESFLHEVSAKGYADNYSGIRISKTGKRFEIKAATVWNIMDSDNIKHGQAALFTNYIYL
ncbi:MEKHLA domain-containing protein [Crenothrix sp.]|uniref:MEKHLA domain-containing protein n=1 Tax=Crenothrix sp. TaxID=3100433 RepID=UPI00374CE4B9